MTIEDLIKMGLSNESAVAVSECYEREEKQKNAAVLKGAVKAGLAAVPERYRGFILASLDMDKVAFNDSGELTGLSEQLDKIKGECPELFGEKNFGIEIRPKEVETDRLESMFNVK